LRDLDICLLAYWVQRYYNSDSKLWRKIVDYKYSPKPNLFYCNDRNGSPFWKSVLWAAKAAKMRFRWKPRDGRIIRFWADLWFESCSLAIQYWENYSIINEQNISLREAWDGVDLKFAFIRIVGLRLINLWFELKQIASSIQFEECEDGIIW
jgi:hypothetical protein